MKSYVAYRFTTLLALAIIPLGIGLFAVGAIRGDAMIDVMIAAQTVATLVAAGAYLMGVYAGMRRSPWIRIGLIVAVVYLVFVWGFSIAFSSLTFG